MRRSSKYVIILFSTVVLAFILFQLNQNKSYKQQDFLKAVPSSAGVIIKAKNISYLNDRLIRKAKFKNDLLKSEVLTNALQPLFDIDSLGFIEANIIEEFKKMPLCASLHAEGKDDVKWFYIIQLENKRNVIELEATFDHLNQGRFAVSSRKYNGSKIYELSTDQQTTKMYLAINNGLVLISQSELLVESSLRQLKSKEDWTAAADFQEIRKTVGNSSSINVFINFKRISNLFKPIFDPSEYRRVTKLEKQSKWGELDVDISEDGILFNGFFSGRQDGVYSYLLSEAEPLKSDLIDVLPSKTRAYLSFAFNDGAEIVERLNNYYESSVDVDKQNLRLRTGLLEDKIDVNSYFFNHLSGRFALAFSDYDHQNYTNNGCLIFEIKSQSQLKASLNNLAKTISGKKTEVHHVYKPDGALSFDIYKGLPKDILGCYFGPFLPKTPKKYYTIYEDYFVFADAIKTLEQFIYSNLLKETLVNSKVHQNYLENFSMRDNVFFFCETAHLASFLEGSMSPLFAHLATDKKEALDNFYALGCQLSGTGSMIYSTMYLQHLPTRASEPHTIWQSLLDTTAIMKPCLVKNHYTKEREVLVQDASNNLYLLSNSGRVLWKRPLDEPIIGSVEQIDYYKNNKLQYLFNTRNKIYILDRNGNYVANFPVHLPSPSTNPVALVDYDENKNYRFFIACENNKVYLYNSKGNVVPGWVFKGSEGKVTQEIQHFRSNNKDYIVFSDHVNNYILDRRGNIRVSLKKVFSRNPFSPFFLVAKNTSNDALLTTNTKGEIVKIQLSTGSVNFINVKEVNGKHRLNCVVKNGKLHYLISQSKEVSLFNNEYKAVFNKTFDDEIDISVDVYHFSSNKIKMGIYQPEIEQIHLLNFDGETYVGFPLRGKSRFSIGFLKSSSHKFNLIVAGTNNYLYNYRVE